LRHTREVDRQREIHDGSQHYVSWTSPSCRVAHDATRARRGPGSGWWSCGIEPVTPSNAICTVPMLSLRTAGFDERVGSPMRSLKNGRLPKRCRGRQPVRKSASSGSAASSDDFVNRFRFPWLGTDLRERRDAENVRAAGEGSGEVAPIGWRWSAMVAARSCEPSARAQRWSTRLCPSYRSYAFRSDSPLRPILWAEGPQSCDGRSPPRPGGPSHRRP
jgi:hypothetical protein